MSKDEVERKDASIFSAIDNDYVVVRPKQKSENETKFSFNKVFKPETSQAAVFAECALPLLDSFFKGINGLIFAYGMTNAGKTYTITGKNDPGLLPRILEQIFSAINPPPESKKRKSTARDSTELEYSSSDFDVSSMSGDETQTRPLFKLDQSMRYVVMISYLEIYNEKLCDLLDDTLDDRKMIKICEDKSGRISAHPIQEIQVRNMDEALQILERGMKNRQVASNKLNHDSSRSHAMLNIKLVRFPKNLHADEILKNHTLVNYTKLSIVDLAGSERSSRTQATGERLQEAANINASLLTLGRCMSILRQNQINPKQQEVVPYRDSKLTRLLQDFFIGNGKAAMVVNVSPTVADYSETLHVLAFSTIAKEVTTVPKAEPIRIPKPEPKKVEVEPKPAKVTIAPVPVSKIPKPLPAPAVEKSLILEEFCDDDRIEDDDLIDELQIEESIRQQTADELTHAIETLRRNYEFQLHQMQATFDETMEKKTQLLTKMCTQSELTKTEEIETLSTKLTQEKKAHVVRINELNRIYTEEKSRYEARLQDLVSLVESLKKSVKIKEDEVNFYAQNVGEQINSEKAKYEALRKEHEYLRKEYEVLLSKTKSKSKTPSKTKKSQKILDHSHDSSKHVEFSNFGNTSKTQNVVVAESDLEDLTHPDWPLSPKSTNSSQIHQTSVTQIIFEQPSSNPDTSVLKDEDTITWSEVELDDKKKHKDPHKQLNGSILGLSSPKFGTPFKSIKKFFKPGHSEKPKDSHTSSSQSSAANEPVNSFKQKTSSQVIAEVEAEFEKSAMTEDEQVRVKSPSVEKPHVPKIHIVEKEDKPKKKLFSGNTASNLENIDDNIVEDKKKSKKSRTEKEEEKKVEKKEKPTKKATTTVKTEVLSRLRPRTTKK